MIIICFGQKVQNLCLPQVFIEPCKCSVIFIGDKVSC